MRYNYKCVNCLKEVVIDKLMSESSNVEHCDKCKKELIRVYGVGISTGDGFKR